MSDETRSNQTISPGDDVVHRAAEAAVGPVSRWAIHRRLYDWVLSLANTKHATWSLFALSFAESSFFPIPPDVLLGPLCLGKRERSLWFAVVTTVASVLGAILGYAIGHYAWEAVQGWMFGYVPGFSQDKFDTVQAWYDAWGVWILFVAAFTPIPFKVFTIAGGVFAQPLLPFIAVSAVGRGARFFLVAGIFWWVGPKAIPFIDKYFNLLCVVFVVLLIGGVMILKLMH
jgi:membrane protein YqaA with SNARE-associated domain